MNRSRIASSRCHWMMLWIVSTSVPSIAFSQNNAYQTANSQQQAYQQSAQQPITQPSARAAGQAANVAQSMATQGQDQQVRVPLVDAQQAVQQGLAETIQQPFPPLQPAEQQYLDQVLDVWEKRTAEVARYECNFKRWQYDPTKFAEDYFSRASGSIKFMDPDKGMFVVDSLETIANKQPTPEYKVDPRRPFGEYWICDGEWIYIRDRNEKKETRYELPPQMQGRGIQMSPLPFLFGVKAVEIKQRYWIRPVQAPPGDDSVWLEAWPKRADDAGNYSRVQVVLDRSDILPRALIVFLPNWRPGSEYKEIYEFSNRSIPKDNLWSAVKEKVFRQAFIPTQLPGDWQIIEEPYIAPEQQAQMQGVAGQDRTAQPPQTGQAVR